MNRLSNSELKEMFSKNKNVSLVEEDSLHFITNGVCDNLLVWFKNASNMKRIIRANKKAHSNKNYFNFKKWSRLTGEELYANLFAISFNGNSRIKGVGFGGPQNIEKGKGGPLLVEFTDWFFLVNRLL